MESIAYTVWVEKGRNWYPEGPGPLRLACTFENADAEAIELCERWGPWGAQTRRSDTFG
jgi:hypothetical protein